LAFGTVDDYPWDTGGFPVFDPYLFVKYQCTSFVASRIDHYRYPPNSFNGVSYNNAKNWYDAARRYGGTVSHTPAVGWVAQRNGGRWGHVAWVAGIDGNDIIVEEYNYDHPEA